MCHASRFLKCYWAKVTLNSFDEWTSEWEQLSPNLAALLFLNWCIVPQNINWIASKHFKLQPCETACMLFRSAMLLSICGVRRTACAYCFCSQIKSLKALAVSNSVEVTGIWRCSQLCNPFNKQHHNNNNNFQRTTHRIL